MASAGLENGPGPSHSRRGNATGMKCTRCRLPAEVQLRQHNAAFCRECFILHFRRQVERAIRKQRMFAADEEVLVAVSGGKDSLGLWDVLHELGYRTTGLHLSLGIGEYSEHSARKTAEFAEKQGLPLITLDLSRQETDVSVPRVVAFTRRPPCSACGILKRHYFDQVAVERGFSVLATGHNLDDEAARLLGNVLHWRADYLARQRPVLESTHEKFVRKVKPLFRCSEYESAVYAFFRGFDYVVEECPNSTGATQLLYKDLLNRLEVVSPGSKLAFVREFLHHGHAGFITAPVPPPTACESCGMPAYGELCSFCRLIREVETRRKRRNQAGS